MVSWKPWPTRPVYRPNTGMRSVTHATVPDSTKRAFLAGMGLAAATDAEAEATLADLDADGWRRLAPPCLVLRCEAEGLDRLPLVLSVPVESLLRSSDLASVAGWRGRPTPVEGDLALDDSGLGVVGDGEVDGRAYRRLSLALPVALAWGYHRLELSAPGTEPAQVMVIVAPWRCYLPPALAEGARLWGPSVQVYALRGRDDWGMGDFANLRALMETSGGEGAGVVGINPLHALFPTRPRHASPYSPSSRLFLNPLYIHIPSVPEVAETPAVADRLIPPTWSAVARPGRGRSDRP